MSSAPIILGIVAIIVLPNLFFVARAGNRTLGKDAFAKRRERMETLRRMREVGELLRDAPDAPETPARKAEFARLKASYEADANAALAGTRSALSGVRRMNFATSGIVMLVVIAMAGYLLYAHFGVASLLAAALIVALCAYNILMNIRAQRAWKLFDPKE